jgi:abortive infection bacteriophage resistance protein
MLTPHTSSKPHLSHAALMSLLVERGMQLGDKPQTERKLAQVGYYRLSGFWFPCREFLRDDLGTVLYSSVSQKPLRQDTFQPGTRFESVFDLYLFDKKLRLQNRISCRLGVHNPKVLKDWLQAINTLRNRCAHHSRIWNQAASNSLPVLPDDLYFQTLALDANAMRRLVGLIAVIWYLLKNIGSNSQWLLNVADVIDSKPDLPGCSFGSIGLADESGFPRAAFGI